MGMSGDVVLDEYSKFLAGKAPRAKMRGIEPGPMPDCLLPHMAHCVDFSLRAGCSGMYLDTGLTKTAGQTEFSRQAAEATNGYALIMTPIAVARQFEREGRANGYDIRVIRDQSDARPGINVCNYDRLHMLDPQAFGSVSLDEAGILKKFGGATQQTLTTTFQHHRFRLAASATPAPNDHMEFGTQCEFLGVMRSMEMLSTFFKNDTSSASHKWRLKRHGVEAFYDWMASWCRMAQMPSDLGFSDDGFILPPLNVHSVETDAEPIKDPNDLFGGIVSATKMHETKRLTADARSKIVVDYAMAVPAEPCVIWCDTNYEADSIMEKFGNVPRTAEIRGSMTIDQKEAVLDGFMDGSILRLVTKAGLTGFGCNWQHCNRTACVGRTFSYEDWYQLIRRFWRFGQKRSVDCLLAIAQGEEQIGRVIERKSNDHISMKAAMRKAMQRATGSDVSRMLAYNPTHNARLQEWIRSGA